MEVSGRPYTRRELENAEERFRIRFPPDLMDLFLRTRIPGGYDWTCDFEDIASMLAWPLDGLLGSVTRTTFWLEDWGEWPPDARDRIAIATTAVAAAPRLIPLRTHRYLPEIPVEAGNPVFSVHQADIIIIGMDLEEWWSLDLDQAPRPASGEPKYIPLWSDIASCPLDYRLLEQI